MTKATRWIGAHVSTAGGLAQAPGRATQIGANCLQVFSGSPRVWARTPLETVDVIGFKSALEHAGMAGGVHDQPSPIITHSLYLVNLASDKPESRAKSAAALLYDLAFDAAIGGSGIVVHLGSHQGRGWEAVREQLVVDLTQILAAAPPAAHFLIENSAGQKGKIASNLAEIRWLIDAAQSPQLGWCMDTCHAFCAGYALDPGAENSVAAEISRLNLWNALKCLHINDARDPQGSGRDRHANLGDGLIPTEDLRKFLALPELQTLPMIMEVPGIEGNGPDAENIARLKALV